MRTIEEIGNDINLHENKLAELKTELQAVNRSLVKGNLKITYSAARDSFYVSDNHNRPYFWMSVKRFDEKPESVNSTFGPNAVELRKTDGSPQYFRLVWPFAYWKVKSSDRKVPVSLEDQSQIIDAVKDYICLHVDHYKWEGYER